QENEVYTCHEKQVCVEDSFCYADENEDFDPDSNEPLEGYYYKITWGVSAPSDEAFTPFLDENGVAVSFNIYLDDLSLYKMGGVASKGAIELNNGNSDQDFITHYSAQQYTQACIKWDKAPESAHTVGGELVDDVCFDVEITEEGHWVVEEEYDDGGSASSTASVSGGEVSRSTNW
ncbi:MAG: hypothetical protein KJ597_02915, partial [Nanoarchaeota archaeon]|nr:hypothetical protein [Nanoarchaeota archaeon]